LNPLIRDITNTNGIEPDLTQRKQEWKSKILHGKFPKVMQEDWVDRSASLKWLQDGYLCPETEGFVMATQDRVIRTDNYQKNILKLDIADKFGKCGKAGE
jgi:hypothetical protein